MVVAKRDPRVLVAPQYVQQKRTTRRPQHRFNLRFKPYEINPFVLAPVLPGETLTNIMLQAQCWSDPLVSSMKNIGWWLQYNFFYVRHRDLPEGVRLLLTQMMIDPETDISSLLTSAVNRTTYAFDGSIDWAKMCLEHITSEYFRDEGEDWNKAVGPNGLPLVQIYGRGTSDALEKLTTQDAYEDRRVDLIDAEGHLYANDMSTMYGHWAAMRDAGLTEMDYEDFMRTYGSQVREDEASPNLHRAEDLWSLREFTYPTNTVEPTTGVPAVAVGWRTQKSGAKRVFCDEPGFVFGVMYTRPKVYISKQTGSVAGAMQSVQQWLPAILHDQASLGHVFFGAGEGPVPIAFGAGADQGYWLDVRDLLVYGDQFINYDPAAEAIAVDLPESATDAQRRYVAAAETYQMFVGADGTAKSQKRFEVDGIASISILGRQHTSQSGLVLGKS